MSAAAVRDAFRRQAAVCAELGSPFTARLCALAAERLAPGGVVADRLLGWPGDPSNRADALPLRFAGALHALALAGDADLATVYPPQAPTDAALWQAVAAAMTRAAGFVDARLDGPPQTNEPQRSNALAPGCLAVAAETGLPLALSEIGASAGLNLIWDRYAFRFGPAAWGDPEAPVRLAPAWSGPAPVTPDLPPGAIVAERAGCDRAPLDVSDPATELRLLSFVWADQSDRLARLRAALALARTDPPALAQADAADWVEARFAAPRAGRAHVLMHSIVWQYLPPATRARIAAAIAAAGSRATAAAPVAWLRLEADDAAPGAALSLTLWPGGGTRTLARADFHGRWVDWRG